MSNRLDVHPFIGNKEDTLRKLQCWPPIESRIIHQIILSNEEQRFYRFPHASSRVAVKNYHLNACVNNIHTTEVKTPKGEEMCNWRVRKWRTPF